MTAAARWYRDVYRDALWEAEDLDATAKAVAETYARHARDKQGNKGPDADLAWLTYERLMAKAGLGRRASVPVVVDRLVKAGWLTVETQVHRRPTVYRLTIPSSAVGTSAGSSTGGTSVVPPPYIGSSTQSKMPESGSSTGGTPPLEELPLLKSPSLSRPPPQAKFLKALGVDEREREVLIQKIEEQNNVQSIGWWINASRNGTLADCLDRARAAPAAAPAKPPHCGKCDENRQITVDRGGQPAMARCPDCHPARPRNGGNGWDGPNQAAVPRRQSATDRAIAEGLAVVAYFEEQERLGATFTPALGATPRHTTSG